MNHEQQEMARDIRILRKFFVTSRLRILKILILWAAVFPLLTALCAGLAWVLRHTGGAQ